MTSNLVTRNATSVSTPPGYSHAVTAAGLIFVSGQVAFDAHGSVVGVGDMAEQTRQAFRNLGAVLEAAGASFADVVKLTYFVRDIEAVAAIRAVRNEFVKHGGTASQHAGRGIPARHTRAAHRNRGRSGSVH